MEEARFTLRIHPITMNKMKHLAKINGRSVNKEIEQILKWVIDDYERQYGKIELTKAEMPGFSTGATVKEAPEQPMDMLFGRILKVKNNMQAPLPYAIQIFKALLRSQ